MQKVHCEINGLTHYYFNKYVNGTPGKSEKAEKEHALQKIFHDDNGLYFPGIQIQGCMINAIRFAQMKLGKSMTRPIEFIKSTLQKPEEIYFTPKMKLDDIELVKERTKVGQGQQEVLRENWYARISTKWGAAFDIEFADLLPTVYIEEALRTGGQYNGIGGRRNWQRGRFEVTKFEMV